MSEGAAFLLPLPADSLEALAARVAEIQGERRQDEEYLSVAEVADFLGDISSRQVYRLVERREIPHRKIGGRLLFPRGEVRAWVEREGMR